MTDKDFNFRKINIFKFHKTILVFTLVTLVLVLFFSFSKLNRENKLEVVFLDIGQGDSILIKSPMGENLIIDTGSNLVSSQKIQKNLFYLNSFIDKIILTHPDLDHSGGTKEILKASKVGNIIVSTENKYETKEYEHFTKVSKVNNDNYLNFKNFKIEIISPSLNYNKSVNSKSIVNLLDYGKYRFIFTGDIEAEVERELIFREYFGSLNKEEKKINILKIAHHGSKTSSSDIFLKKIKPEYCVISVGINNKYGHPDKKTLENIYKYCKNVYRTDANGSVSFKVDGKNLEIKTEK